MVDSFELVDATFALLCDIFELMEKNLITLVEASFALVEPSLTHEVASFALL